MATNLTVTSEICRFSKTRQRLNSHYNFIEKERMLRQFSPLPTPKNRSKRSFFLPMGNESPESIDTCRAVKNGWQPKLCYFAGAELVSRCEDRSCPSCVLKQQENPLLTSSMSKSMQNSTVPRRKRKDQTTSVVLLYLFVLIFVFYVLCYNRAIILNFFHSLSCCNN